MNCPKCGSPEIHPDGRKLIIHGYRITNEVGEWWSQCLVCAGFYEPFIAPQVAVTVEFTLILHSDQALARPRAFNAASRPSD